MRSRLVLSLVVWAAWYAVEHSGSGATAVANETVAPLELDRRGLAPRRFELSPFAGSFIGDRLHSAAHLGARVETRLLSGLSLGADFGWSPAAYDAASPFGQLARGDDLYAIQGVVLLNLPAALVIAGNTIVADLFGSVGGGVLRVAGFDRGAGFLGGGMKMYPGKLQWLGLRFEVRSYFSSLPSPTGALFTSDFALMIGPTFMLPPTL